LKTKNTDGHPSYQIFVLFLCFIALGLMAIQTAVDSNSPTQEIIDYADYVICAFFVIDFVVSLIKSEDRRKYLVTWGWIDLLSSIPAIDVLRWGRAARVLRVFRVLRGFRATRLLATIVLKNRTENAVLAASLIVILLLTFCSIAVLHFETVPTSNIQSAEDAIWWSCTTFTTVGYGDKYPVTREGRLVAVVLMAGGICVLGILSGLFASWFIGPKEDQNSHELERLSKEVAALREILLNEKCQINETSSVNIKA
jgi:voltage-gated potassium channel